MYNNYKSSFTAVYYCHRMIYVMSTTQINNEYAFVVLIFHISGSVSSKKSNSEKIIISFHKKLSSTNRPMGCLHFKR